MDLYSVRRLLNATALPWPDGAGDHAPPTDAANALAKKALAEVVKHYLVSTRDTAKACGVAVGCGRRCQGGDGACAKLASRGALMPYCWEHQEGTHEAPGDRLVEALLAFTKLSIKLLNLGVPPGRWLHVSMYREMGNLQVDIINVEPTGPRTTLASICYADYLETLDYFPFDPVMPQWKDLPAPRLRRVQMTLAAARPARRTAHFPLELEWPPPALPPPVHNCTAVHEALHDYVKASCRNDFPQLEDVTPYLSEGNGTPYYVSAEPPLPRHLAWMRDVPWCFETMWPAVGTHMVAQLLGQMP